MNKKYEKLIVEEIDKQVDKFDLGTPDKIKTVINELFFLNSDKLISSIGSVESDTVNGIAQENWDWFLQMLTKSIGENPEEWLTSIKKVKVRILTYKYFTKNEMLAKESIEQHLRVNIKPFFTALQNYVDSNDFRSKVFNLPSDLLYCLVRYIFNISEDLKSAVKVDNDELKQRIVELMELRIKVAARIGEVSRGYQNIFSIAEVKELYDNGLLFEDNFINRAINEYISKLMNHKTAVDKLKDLFPGSLLKDLKATCEKCASYIAHVTSIKQEQGQEYFTINGEQIGRRFDNELELVKNKGGDSYDGYVVDKDSRFKEPNARINSASAPWESGGSAPAGGVEAGGGGGSSSGGGSTPSGGSDFGGSSGGFGGDFGGDFAEPGEEGTIPGMEDGADGDVGGVEADGTPMPTDEQGLPQDFGTQEDNTETPTEEGGDETTDDTEKKVEDKK